MRPDPFDASQRIMQARLTRREGVRQGKAMLAGLVRCGKCGRKVQVAYKDNRFQYVCCKSVTELAQRSCQFLSGDRIDDSVLTAFFAAIQPTNIDALQATTQQQAAEREQRLKLIRQEVERLNYAAHRAERQYDKVDPENRLIAATLERKWEQAMDELERARSSLADSERAPTPILKISAGDRKSFSNVGQELPELEKQTVERVKKLTDEGFTCDAIIDKLNAEGHIPCRGGQFTKAILTKLKVRYGIVSKLEQVRRGLRPKTAYSAEEIAAQIPVDRAWIYRKIRLGTIRINKDPIHGCYFFPRTKTAIQQLRQLKQGTPAHVSF